MKARVAILFDNFGPYHVARLAGAARAGLEVLGVEARANSDVYAWESPEFPEGLTRARLDIGRDGNGYAWGAVAAALDRELAPFAPQAIAVPGWSSPTSLGALDWAAKNSVPAIIMSESNADDFARRAMAEGIKRLLVGLCSAGLVGGDRAKAYLVSLGLPGDAVFLGYDAVDNLYFETNAERVRRDGAMPELELGQTLDPRWRGRYFLASARFVEKKNLPRLIEAYAQYRAARLDADDTWPLVVLGDGALRGRLEAMCRSLGLEGVVHMPGFRQYGELPKFYGSAGAFIHASATEQWGLVVNEAMASGLPVAVSNRCGCAEALVEDGENGVIFDPHDTNAIASALARIANHPDLEELGAASRRRIASWGPECFGEGMAKAAQAAIGRGSERAGPARRAVLRVAAAIQALPRAGVYSFAARS